MADVGADNIPDHPAGHNPSGVVAIQYIEIPVIGGNRHVCVKLSSIQFDIAHVNIPPD